MQTKIGWYVYVSAVIDSWHILTYHDDDDDDDDCEDDDDDYYYYYAAADDYYAAVDDDDAGIPVVSIAILFQL